MGSQITKIPSICGDNYPGVGYQVDGGDSVRVAMAWPSASAEGWRSLTMEVPKKLSLDTELNGVSVETLLKAAGHCLEIMTSMGLSSMNKCSVINCPARLFALSPATRLSIRLMPATLRHVVVKSNSFSVGKSPN